MTKTTIELARLTSIKGYGYLNGPPWRQDSQNTLDALVAWNALPENVGKTIVKHFVHSSEQPRSKIEWHYSSENGLSDKECAELFAKRLEEGRTKEDLFNTQNSLAYRGGMVYRSPICDDVYSVDIYWQ